MYLKSECCSAPPWLGEPDLNRCSECKESTEFYDEDTGKPYYV